MPILYRTVHFRLPARFMALDRVIQKLEIFTEPSFHHLQWTKQVIVVGSWYHEYTELESDAGIENVLSPAIRMFSTLVDVCLAKMNGLESFIWDAEIPPTQRLVSRLAHHVSLRELQLRLGIDDTPYPLFYPPLNYRQYSQLTTIKLNQINSEDVLRTTGGLLSSVRLLRHFYIDVDPDVRLDFSMTFSQLPQGTRLPLTTFFAKGFSDFSPSNGCFWDLFFPNTLRDLTIEGGAHMTEESVKDFWRVPTNFQHSLAHLITNLVDSSLVDFISTCLYLDTIVIHTCEAFQPGFEYEDIIKVLRRSVRKMKCVGFYPQPQENQEQPSTASAVDGLKEHCPNLEEVGFSLDTDDLPTIEKILSVANLKILHILPTTMDPEFIEPRTIYYDATQFKSSDYQSSYSSSPSFPDGVPLGPQMSRRSTPTTRNNQRQPVRRQGSIQTSAAAATQQRSQKRQRQGSESQSQSQGPPIQSLPQIILHHISMKQTPHLKILAFNHNFPYQVKHEPLRLERMQGLISSVVERSHLFRWPFLEWAKEDDKTRGG